MSILNKINFDGKGNKIKNLILLIINLEKKIYLNNEI